jgi:predicted dehydrogenase
MPERRRLAAEAAGLGDGDAHEAAAGLLARPDVDLVDVCTPQHLRGPIVSEAIASGRHVLAEKPLATTPAAAAALADAAAARGVVLAVMHNYLHLAEVAALLQATRSGAIGDVEVVEVAYLGVVDLPGAAAFRPLWRHDPALAGGGVLVDMLHAVYVADAFLPAPVERVSAWLHARTTPAPVEDVALLRLEADGCAALVSIGWGYGRGGISVSGSRGRGAISYRDGGTGQFAPLEEVTLHVANEAPRSLVADPAAVVDDSVGAVLADLHAALTADGHPTATGADGVRCLELCLAAYASAARMETVRVPLDPDGALYRHGVLALEAVPGSTVGRRRIFAVDER